MDIKKYEDIDLEYELLCYAEIFIDQNNSPGNLGQNAWNDQRVAYILSGSFEGPLIKGKVLPGGGDWPIFSNQRPNIMKSDVRAVWETDDKAKIFVTYTGKIIKPDERILSNHKDVTDIDPKNYYFRMSPDFSTESKKYFWLNDLVTIAIGRLIPNGVGYKIFKIK